MKTVILFSLTLLVAIATAETEIRTWTALSGATVEARFVEQRGADVVLETAAGKQLAIRLDKLSEADQEYVRGLAAPAEEPPAEAPNGVPIDGAAPPAAPAAPAPPAPKPEPAVYADPGGKWKAGEISGAIESAGEKGGPYLLYAPKAFTPKRKWPALFVLDANGGSAAILQRFVPAAELCGWLLIGAPELRAGFVDSEREFAPIVAEVLARLPIDDSRLFAAGYFKATPLAFWFAADRKERPLAGLLLVNGQQGEENYKVPSVTPVYGLCGANNGFRGGMMTAFSELRGGNNFLRFYAGGNAWPSPELLLDGAAWLNHVSLQTAPPTRMDLAREKKAFTQKMEKEIAQFQKDDPERAYEWVQTLAAGSRMPTPQLAALLNVSKVKLYAEAQKDLQKLTKKYLGPRNDLGKDGDDEARKLADKYRECALGEVFGNLVQLAEQVPWH